MFSDVIKAEIFLWCAQKKSPTKVQIMFRAKYRKHRAAPKNTDMQRWTKNFKEAGALSTKRSRSGRVWQTTNNPMHRRKSKAVTVKAFQPFERQCHHYKKVSESRRLQKLWNSYCANYGAHTELLFHGKCSCFLEVFGPSLHVRILWCGPMLSVFGSGHPLHVGLFFSLHTRGQFLLWWRQKTFLKVSKAATK